jgi:hypothetical protein
MYNEQNLYSVRSLVVVHILNFQLDLVVMRFFRIELIILQRDRVESSEYVPQLMILHCTVFAHYTFL